jgi:hypothetical protein
MLSGTSWSPALAEEAIPGLWPAPSVAEAEAIARMADPALRNLHITLAYHRLVVALTRLSGARNVSWCAHATWASKTAGHFIRKEEVPEFVRELLERSDAVTRGFSGVQAQLAGLGLPLSLVQAALSRAIERTADEIARHVAVGNQLVFAELGPLYARLLERLGGLTGPDPAALEGLLAGLRPGPVEAGGQDMLRRAFTCYYEAVLTPEPKARAELLLLGNLMVGYHEQTRLQGPIVSAMNAPFREVLLEELVAGVGSHALGLGGHLAALQEFSVRSVFAPVARWLERRWRELSTQAVMKLELPDVAIQLGEDVPAHTAERAFPPELQELTHPELRRLLAVLDRTPDSTRGSGARDWGSLADRMNLVVDLFRTRAQDRLLYDQPFTFLQVEAFQQGRLPHGRL